jgi:hypothetical protein
LKRKKIKKRKKKIVAASFRVTGEKESSALTLSIHNKQTKGKGLDDSIHTKRHKVFRNRWGDFHAPVHSTVFYNGQTILSHDVVYVRARIRPGKFCRRISLPEALPRCCEDTLPS